MNRAATGVRLVGATGGIALGLLVLPAVAGAQPRPGDYRARSNYWHWYESYPTFDTALTLGRALAWSQVPPSSFRSNVLYGPGTGGRFAPIGPFGIVHSGGEFFSALHADGGRATALALHPLDPSVILVGTANGGVWKSTNGGFSWQALTDDQCGMTIGAVAFDRTNPSTLFAATGEPWESPAHACGVLRSTDGGATWTRLGANVFAGKRIWAMHQRVTDGAGTKALFVASAAGLMRSTDAGASWSRVLEGTFSDVVGHPTDPQVVYAARHGFGPNPTGAALLRSGDGGLAWERIDPVQFGDDATRIELATTPADPSALFVIAGSRLGQGGLNGLYRWDEPAGLTRLAAAGLVHSGERILFGRDAEYSLAIAVDPIDARIIYIGGARAFRSDDGGATFAEIGRSIHAGWHALLLDPTQTGRLVAANDGGVWISRDRGETFSSSHVGMSAVAFNPGLSAHPTRAAVVLGGTQDNGTVRSALGGVYEGVGGGDGGFAFFDPEAPDTVWTTCQYGGVNACIWKRAGAATTLQVTGLREDRTALFPPMIARVRLGAEVHRFAYGTDRLYQHAPIFFGVSSFTNLNWGTPTTDLTKGIGVITALAFSPSEPAWLFIGTSDGNVWTRRDGAPVATNLVNAGLPNRMVTDLAGDPANAATVWVTLGGFGSGHVFRTTDRGVTWVDESAGLPDVPFGAVIAIPGSSRVFVGSDLGVFESPTGRAPWTRVPGLPAVRVTDLVYQPAFNLLIAGTYGRGLWAMELGQPASHLRGDVDRNGLITAADALLIQQALAGAPPEPPLTVFPYGDADCDGTVSALDALIILRYVVRAPVGTACVGSFR